MDRSLGVIFLRPGWTGGPTLHLRRGFFEPWSFVVLKSLH